MIQWCAIATLAFGTGRAAMAAPSDALIKQGVEERRKGNDREALDLFKRAHELDGAPRSLAQVGFAEQALGEWADAETHLRAALASGDDPWIKKNQAVLKKSIDVVAAHLGGLDVWGSPKGAQVTINGVAAGVLPLPGPLRVTAGAVSVGVHAEGFVELTRVVDVPAGSIARERFDLPRKLVKALATDPTPAGAAGADPGPPTLVSTPADRDEERPRHAPVWKRWWFWTAIGVVAIAGGATAFVLLRPRATCDTTDGRMCSSLN